LAHAIAAVIATTLLTLVTSSASAAISVNGNHFVATGKTVRLIGVNRSGSEYACSQNFGPYQGPVDDQAIQAMVTWNINAVAIPMHEACWIGGYGGVNPTYSGQLRSCPTS
jgi:endoglucanase